MSQRHIIAKHILPIFLISLIVSFTTFVHASQDDIDLPPPPKKILALDGGGTRGLWSLEVIEAIESEIQAPISQYVDCFTGTSMGGILSLGYAAGYDTADLKDLILLNKDQIFTPKVSWWNLWGRLTREKYLTQPIEDISKQFFGDLTLGSLKKPVVIPTANITKMQPHLFSRYDPESLHEPAWFVARSTSAAPTYFEPTKYQGDALVDGGLVTNNPALLASLHLNSIYRGDFLNNVSVISIGTGSYDPGISYETSRHMGLIRWAPPITSVLMDMNTVVDDRQMSNLLTPGSYIRLNTEFDQAVPLDAVRSDQIGALRQSAQSFIVNNRSLIQRAASLLMR